MVKIAIIATGGKQYVISEGTVLDIEKISSKVGDKVVFDQVLLTDDGTSMKTGTPMLDGAKVSAELIAEGREKKVTVIRYRQKSRYFKKKGHRQAFSKVKITALP
jgi:large subunit ribosomal protein L21